MKLACVLGWPIAHSLSPRLHSYWLSKYRIDGAYLPFAVQPGRVETAMRGLAALGFSGGNVTIPHKLAALKAADSASSVARRIGAANTFVIAADGAIEATNTDAAGFWDNLREALPNFSGKRAVLLGAGGAARAVAVALQDQGAGDILIANRSPERAASLVADLGAPLRAGPWPAAKDDLAQADLLVNCTSLGQKGQPPLALDLSPLPARAIVNDLVYNPLRTALLAAAEKRGLHAVDGLGMLLGQARPGFAAWFGIEPEIDAGLRAHMVAALVP